MKKRVALYSYTAVFSSLLKFYDNNEIAKKVVEIMKDDLNAEYDVYKTNSDGFVFRRKKDDNVSTTDIMRVLAKAVRQLIKQDKDDIVDYIQDNYDIEVDLDMIDSDFSDAIFEITKNGRLITVEFEN